LSEYSERDGMDGKCIKSKTYRMGAPRLRNGEERVLCGAPWDQLEPRKSTETEEREHSQGFCVEHPSTAKEWD
jgi:hypothetical protein